MAAASACVGPRVEQPVLRVGTSGDYPPFSATTTRGGFDGLDVAVMRLFARDTGYRVEFVPFRWPELVAGLRDGRFDLAVGGVTLRPERAVASAFTRPIVRVGAVVLARKDVAMDRPGVRLAVNAGGHLERVATRLFPDATLVPTSENRRLSRLVAEGSVDALLTDEIEAGVIAADLPELRRLGPFTRDAKAYAGRDPTLVARLDGWLREREIDGTLAALRARWLGPSWAATRSGAASDLQALLALVDLRLAFMPVVAAWKLSAGRPVEDPAQEARVVGAARRHATEAGLDAESAETLFRALILAARAVETSYLARPWRVDAMDLDTVARPALARVSEEIIARAHDVAADRGLASLTDDAIAAELDPSWATPDARLAIARAIHDLRDAGFVKENQLR